VVTQGARELPSVRVRPTATALAEDGNDPKYFLPEPPVRRQGRNPHLGRQRVHRRPPDDTQARRQAAQPTGRTFLVRFAPSGSGGFLAHYRFVARNGKLVLVDMRYRD
jgi:hypothetical protein